MLLICIILLLSIPFAIAAQVDCSLRQSGSSGNPGGLWQRYCDEPPTDIVGANLTCWGCQPGTSQHPPYFSHGGSKNCQAYSKQMLITFNQPVADLEWEVFGARFVTDNRGFTVHLDPPLDSEGYPIGSDVARFPGGGITSILISDPFEKDVFSNSFPRELLYEGAWEIHSWNHSWTVGSVYQQCNCSRPGIQAPPSQNVSTNWAMNADGTDPNWSMIAEISANDGLVLRNIRLGSRYMMEKISVPYYYLQTSVLPNTRGQLKPTGADSFMNSRLVNFQKFDDSEKLVLEATYSIDKLPDTSSSCLQIVQRYEFYKTRPGDTCEPSAKLPCSRWKPIVRYEFFGQNGETLTKLNIAQRQHRMVEENQYNSVGLFKDGETVIDLAENMGVFTRTANPLGWEAYYWMAIGGERVWDWDNVHQTMLGLVDEPGIDWHLNNWDPRRAGCPECLHSHWRWGVVSGGDGGGRLIGVPSGSNQDMDFAIVKYQSGEDDPARFLDLVNFFERIRTWDVASRDPLQVYLGSAPEDVVYWQSGTGYQTRDSFFGFGGFYRPAIPTPQLLQPSGQSSTSKLSSGPMDPVVCEQDGVKSIVPAEQYSTGPTDVLPFDAAVAGPLPAGYSQVGDLSYDVVTEAEISGPNTVTFCVPSVTDPAVFNNLRVFHLERDPYAPSQLLWVDRTILAPGSPAPDFQNKTISSRSATLGQFVVASLTDPQPPNTNVADISVSSSDSPDQAVIGNDVTLTFTVHNGGPQNATGVLFNSSPAAQLHFVSANASQGTCAEAEGSVVCKLGPLASGNNAIVNVVVRPVEGSIPPPSQGTVVTSSGFAKASEIDPNSGNNLVSENTTIKPDNNSAPSVAITTPVHGTITTSTTLALAATASDSDGSIVSVDFYSDGELLGAGTQGQPGQYTFDWLSASLGRHILTAIAKDNLNKRRVSTAVAIIVNGPANVAITSPLNFTYFNRPSNTTLTAAASVVGGTISKVDFYVDGNFLGTGTPGGLDQYSRAWNDVPSGTHVITAEATDSLGDKTWSTPVTIIANDPPVIGIMSPAAGTVYLTSPASIPIIANVSDDGYARQVDFYANGSPIGTKTLSGVNQFPFTWNNVNPGTYAITAVAKDNLDATSTSPPITVRVNSAPSISLTAPTNGTQFTSPASINLSATASDTDGTLTSVTFFANGTNIGSGTPAGGNQYNFTWSNIGVGTYAIKAKATDNDGVIRETTVSTVTVKWPALFVVGSTTLNTGDTAVKNRLEALGYTLTTMTGSAVTTADANGKVLVVISSTVTPTSVGTKFRTVAVPVLTWESGLYANMGMTGTGSQDSGTKTNQSQIAVVNVAHPLAAGFPGNRIVTASNATMNWGKPNANGAKVATVVGDANKTLIFGYETGAVMPGLTAPARRVGLFMDDTSASILTAEGNALLDAAIQWARGQTGSPTGGTLTGTFGATPASVNLTTEGTVDWAHWGRSGALVFNHKANTSLISDILTIGNGPRSWFSDCPTAFSWTDGTPTTSVTNTTTGTVTNGVVGNGLEITVPADTNLRTLKLYVGVWFTRGKVEASLSDGSAPNYVDSTMDNNNGKINGVYTINYKAGSAGQVLKLRLSIVNQYNPPFGNVAWEAVTVQ